MYLNRSFIRLSLHHLLHCIKAVSSAIVKKLLAVIYGVIYELFYNFPAQLKAHKLHPADKNPPIFLKIDYYHLAASFFGRAERKQTLFLFKSI